MGRDSGIWAATIFFFARVMRAAIVGVDTRNRRAIWAVGVPMTSRSASADRDVGCSAGWQQSKTRARRSSSSSANRSGLGGCSHCAVTASKRALRPWMASARSRPATSRDAVVYSQPAGLSGTPADGQRALARANASPSASSARSSRRVRVTSIASSRPQLAR